jgi:L-alanine-DL-glutamate epimerase-like enolase superfamily enzyme
MDVRIERRVLRFARPLPTAYGELRERPLLELTIRGADGVEGRGEAAPLEPYDGVPMAAVEEALRAYGRILRDADDLPGGALLDACREAADLPPALAALDMALWDRAGRREGRPVAALITDDPAPRVRVNASIAAEDRAGAATAAAEAARAGYTCVKVKVGVGDDAGRVAAVRAAAPDTLIRIDANGAWTTPREALANLRALAPVGIELCEEPIHGADQLAAVRAESPIAIACDETFAPESVDVVCLKVARGGITAVLEAARQAEDVYLASSYDGPIGLRAAVHVAAGLRLTRHCGLATGGLQVREGRISL